MDRSVQQRLRRTQIFDPFENVRQSPSLHHWPEMPIYPIGRLEQNQIADPNSRSTPRANIHTF